MFEVKTRKNQMRHEYREKRRNISPEKKAVLDKKICERFVSLASYHYAETIFAYAPIKDEIDIFPIISDALRRGKVVAFPRCNPSDSTMTYHKIEDISQLQPGSFGILEPDATLPIVEFGGSCSICIIPAVVYDKSGFRVGYGKGYYDRYLVSFPGVKAGIIYDEYLIDSVPHGKYDLSVNIIVTEKGVKSFV